MFGRNRTQDEEPVNGYSWVIHRRYFTEDEAEVILNTIFEAVGSSLRSNGWHVPGTGLDSDRSMKLRRFSGSRNGFVYFAAGDGVYFFALVLDERTGPPTPSEQRVIDQAVEAGTRAGKRLPIFADVMIEQPHYHPSGPSLPWHMF